MRADDRTTDPIPYDFGEREQEEVDLFDHRGVSLYVEVHMTEDAQEPTVSQFVQEAPSRGHTVAYDRNAYRRVDSYVEWSGDQHLEAEELERWIAALSFVRLW